VPTAEPSKYSHGCGMGARHLQDKSAFDLSLRLGALYEPESNRANLDKPGTSSSRWRRKFLTGAF
jgi:hypothetical protein